MKRAVIGILAHVDAGKTTLAEALLYHTGSLRRLGRVDHGDTALDTHTLERERGITIFASQAELTHGDWSWTLLDTPGHVDFSAETERTLQVLDYAILVISGTDGVQAHTRTLWRLLELYRIPTFVFVTKMDLAHRSEEELLAELQQELSEGCLSLAGAHFAAAEEAMAMKREDLMERYFAEGTLSDRDAAELIRAREVFPCYFGSGLRLQGIEDLLEGLQKYLTENEYPEAFGAKVYKISHDGQGNRLTHLKVTGGRLAVRDVIGSEKASQLRIYSGAKFTAAEEVPAGGICAVLGLSDTRMGQGLGIEAAAAAPVLEPVMTYRLLLPEGCDARTLLPKLRRLEEEDPQLHITWQEQLQEIHVGLMGAVQAEILRALIAERFGVEVGIDSGRVLYRETITNTVEGVGHYEPLRHYAEAHFILEPLPRGSGMQFAADCSEDALDRNWQQLILTHLLEKQHLGVLTGSPITDIKITLVAGKAHLKHTEGGDFRQATYRGVRQGLMQAESVLLEPYYAFRLEVPAEQIGRAMSDIRLRHGTHGDPEPAGSLTLLQGRVPVAAMNDYALEVAGYTHGRGRLFCEPAGYDLCHNAEEVIAAAEYSPEADLENTPDSVFCAHGGGYTVKWRDVPREMHLPAVLKKAAAPAVRRRNISIDDDELRAIINRALGPERRTVLPTHSAQQVLEAPDRFMARQRPKKLLVDGYNVLYAWEDLRAIAETNLDAARNQLMNILANYSAYTHCETTLVFDAYKVSGNSGKSFAFHELQVVYTKENESADLYIEKQAAALGKHEEMRIVTSDALIQVAALRSGVLRMSAREFEHEVNAVAAEIDSLLQKTGAGKITSLGEQLRSALADTKTE